MQKIKDNENKSEVPKEKISIIMQIALQKKKGSKISTMN